jgi:hypothetical protein
MITHIDIVNATLLTEADVEHKVIMPLLVGEAYLRIPEPNRHAKEYLAPAALDKTSGKSFGYYPDFTAWLTASRY